MEAVRSRGFAVSALAVAAFALAFMALPGFARADGTPDSGFGGDGRVTFDPLPAFSEYTSDLAIDSKGRIVAVGTAFNSGILPSQGYIARFLSDGTPDPSFDGDGFKPFSVAVGPTSLDGVRIESGDRITAGGYTVVPGNGFDFFAVRVLESGAPDPSFSGDGMTTVDFGPKKADVANDLTLDSRNRLVLAGYTAATGTTAIAVARLNNDGSPDTDLNGTGIAIPDVGGTYSSGSAVEIDGNDRILVGATISRPAIGTDFLATRLRPEGSFDPSFGGDGRVIVDFAADPSESANDLAIDAQSRIVLAGSSGPSEDYDTALARLLPTGLLDQSFSEDGRVRITGTDSNYARSVAIDSANRVVTAGAFVAKDSIVGDSLLTRFSDGGAFDTAFGEGGLLREDFFAASADADGLVIDGAGRYLIAGRYTSGTDQRIGLARFTVDYPKPPNPPVGPGPDPDPATARCAGKKATIVGTSGRDVLRGTGKRDVIAGLAGKDRLIGRGGNDLICGGNGPDKLVGSGGNDLLRGDKGNDVVNGGPGKDRLLGKQGSDSLIGGPGRDLCKGGPRRDRVRSCEAGRA